MASATTEGSPLFEESAPQGERETYRAEQNLIRYLLPRSY